MPPLHVATRAQIERPSHNGEREADIGIEAGDVGQIGKLRRKELYHAFEPMFPKGTEPFPPFRIGQQIGMLREASQRVSSVQPRCSRTATTLGNVA